MPKKNKTYSNFDDSKRIWYELKEYKPDKSILYNKLTSNSLEDKLDIIQNHLPVNEYILLKTIESENTSILQNYIEELRELGLDIGKGNCQYGYKMPHIKDKGLIKTELHIFKRK